MDAAAALKWVGEHERRSGAKNRETPIVVWGQSIGSGVASILAARQDLFSEGLVLKFLILETPFLSIRAMLETLYPQKWLPYKYLWPFLRNHLDSDRALGIMQQSCTANHRTPPRVLILEAGRDELVPKEHGDALEARCNELRLDAKRQAISGALHTEVLVRSGGSKAVAEAIQQVARELHEDQT
jgi:acetyl esterase/lipase